MTFWELAVPVAMRWFEERNADPQSEVSVGCRGETGAPGARQVQASSTQIPLLLSLVVLQAPVEMDAVVDSVQILAKCNYFLNRQAYNLQQGTMQVGLVFFPRPRLVTVSRQALFPPFVSLCFCHADLQRSPLGSQHFFIKTLEVFRLLVANMLFVVGCSSNFQ